MGRAELLLPLSLMCACASTRVDPEHLLLEEEIVVLVNEMRASGGSCPTGGFASMSALGHDDKLRGAAREHSLDMAAAKFFDHTGSDGRTPDLRADDAGYAWSRVAENIAAGSSTAEGTFNQWLTSAEHCANMFNPELEDIGVVYAFIDDDELGHYWTQLFGAR